MEQYAETLDKPVEEETNCMNCLERHFSLFSDLEFDHLSILDSHRSKLQFKSGEYIFKEGEKPEGLLCLSLGKVKNTINGMNGMEQVISLKKPVEFLGFSDLITNQNYSSNAVAMEECKICFIPKKDFDKVLSENNSLSQKIGRFFASRLKISNRRMSNLTQKHMIARISNTLILLSRIYGFRRNDKNSLNIHLKRSDIASLSNMTTSNALRILSELVQANIISLDDRNIRILNMKALQKNSLRG
jgi:CRP-like cAMP-binding protein